MEGDSDRVVAGNFTEWRNNVSYATFPEWRTVGRGGQGELANTQRAREEERECNRDGENGREKEEEMQSLSGMQLGARHRPGKDSSLSVFLLESSFSFFPQALRLSLSPFISFAPFDYVH